MTERRTQEPALLPLAAPAAAPRHGRAPMQEAAAMSGGRPYVMFGIPQSPVLVLVVTAGPVAPVAPLIRRGLAVGCRSTDRGRGLAGRRGRVAR